MKNFGNIQTTKDNQIASYYTDSGAADAYVVTLRPVITAYTAGLRILIKASNTNTGTSTLNVNGLGVKTIKKNVSSNLAGGDITSGQVFEVVYDGTNFQLLNSSTTGGGTVTADNGLNMSTSTNVQIGGTLLKNTSIDASTFMLTLTKAAINQVLNIVNTGGQGLGVSGTSIGAAIQASGTNPLWVIKTSGSTSTVERGFLLQKTSTGATSAGVGISIDFGLTNAGNSTNAPYNQIISKLLTTTAGSELSELSFTGLTGVTTNTLFSLRGDGQAKLNKYGVGTFTGTTAYYLTEDSSGNIIESTAPGIDTVLAVGQSLSTNRDIPGAYNLSVGTGTLTVGATATVGAAKFYVNQTATGLGAFFKKDGFPTTGENSFGADFQRIVGSGTFGGSNSVVGGYGELGFNNGNFIFSGPAYTGLNGINGVVTIYPGGGSLTANNSIFAGGQYNLFLSGTGTVDKFACIRLLYPVLVPSQTFTGIITNHYGLYIDDTTASSNSSNITNRWGIYQQGSTDTNVFGSKKNSFGATGTPTSAVDITGATGYTQLRLRTSITPSGSADGAGNTGDWAWDDNFIYVKVSTGWKRSALSTF